jgi:hypothetical protein
VVRKYYIRFGQAGARPVTLPNPVDQGTHTGMMPHRRRSWPSTSHRLLYDVFTLIRLALTSRARLAAENLFLRKQLALYHERGVKPRRPDSETRAILVLLSRVVDWRSVLTVVKPDTLILWHVRVGACSGGGSRGQDGRPFRRTCSDSSWEWPKRIPPGVRNGSRTS